MNRYHSLLDQHVVKARSRRGISTIWMIVALPVVMAMLVVVLDIGHIWLARAELKNALDAAALSGIKTWGEGGGTGAARDDANDAIGANTVLGTALTLDTNNTSGGGLCVNGNPSSTGEIVLGTITDNNGLCTFDCNQVPCPTATVVFAVDTANTFADSNAFRVESFTGPAGSTIDSITMDLASIQIDDDPTAAVNSVGDNGFFDFRAGAGDAASGLPGSPVTGGMTTGGTITSAAGAGTPTSLTVTFSDLNPGEEHYFGVDTDEVGHVAGEADSGGEFGAGFTIGDQSTTLGMQVTIVVNGVSVMGRLISANNNRSVQTFVFTLTNNTGFGIRTRKTIQVNSVGSNFLGLGLGPYNVTAESFARYACSGGSPRLAWVDVFSCTCP